MRKLLLFCLWASISMSFAQTDSILFLGNSYTSTSDLPGTLKSLAASGGKSLYVESYTPGGKQLNQHANDPTSFSYINKRDWKYVVLQEQSQMPLVNPFSTQYYAQVLVDSITSQNICIEPIIYMTWARQEGNSWLQSTGLTHAEMAEEYEDFYGSIYEWTTGRVSPVGAAFHEATRRGINVYSGDGSHQNTNGTYLAACVFYATIYKESPVGLSYSKASTPELRDELQEIAAEIVLNNLFTYNIDKLYFEIGNNDIAVGESIQFLEWVYIWDYADAVFEWNIEGADQEQTNDASPLATYNSAGIFDVSMTVTSNCFTGTRTLSDTIRVGQVTGINGKGNDQKFSLYPTLASTQARITIVAEDVLSNNYILTTSTGRSVPFSISAENELLFEKKAGAYILSHQSGGFSKIVIEK